MSQPIASRLPASGCDSSFQLLGLSHRHGLSRPLRRSLSPATGPAAGIDLVGSSHNAAFRKLKLKISRLDPGGDFLHYHGAVPYSEIHRYYQNAELFVFGSTCENLPMILLEAMAAGLPIACSNRGPMPEILEGAGRYFDPESLQSIVETISALVRDARLRARLAAEAFERAAVYSWERCAQETFSFLQECLNAGIARKVA